MTDVVKKFNSLQIDRQEAIKQLISRQRATCFLNDGKGQDWSHLNCPTCGGSGHVDDAIAKRHANHDEIERLRALVGEHKIALDRHNSEIRGELVAVLAENKRLRAQVATLTETIEAAQQALNAAPAWHQGIRDAIDVLKKIEE